MTPMPYTQFVMLLNDFRNAFDDEKPFIHDALSFAYYQATSEINALYALVYIMLEDRRICGDAVAARHLLESEGRAVELIDRASSWVCNARDAAGVLP